MILYIHCSIPFSIPPLHSIFHSTVTFHIPLQLLETPNTGHECGLSCNGAYFLHKERCRKITNFAWLIFHQLFNYQEVLSPSVLCKFVFTTFSPHTVNASAPFTPPSFLNVFARTAHTEYIFILQNEDILVRTQCTWSYVKNYYLNRHTKYVCQIIISLCENLLFNLLGLGLLRLAPITVI